MPAKTHGRAGFLLMSALFRLRDLISAPEEKLVETGLAPGMRALDYGCGPGGYTLAAARIVGTEGRVWAADVNPLAVEAVRKKAARWRLGNVEPLLTDRETGLADESLDVILFYDVFHALGDPEGVLDEFYRILKPYGILSFRDHHMKADVSRAAMTRSGRFRFSHQGVKTSSYVKAV